MVWVAATNLVSVSLWPAVLRFREKKGKAADDILDGFFDLDGQLPCQPAGGLKCFGHPIGASGLRMIYEMYSQLLRRWDDERLVKDPHIALTHNLGGVPNQNVCSIAIMGLD